MGREVGPRLPRALVMELLFSPPRQKPEAPEHSSVGASSPLLLTFRNKNVSRKIWSSMKGWLIGFRKWTAFRYYRVRGDSAVRWRRSSDGPVRRALGCGLVLAVARDDHGPTAARLAL